MKLVPALDPDASRLLSLAEMVEVLSASQARGWDCGASNGEALSRVLAADHYPFALVDGEYATAAWWLNWRLPYADTRPDWVNRTYSGADGDRNPLANGCGVAFLNYLRHKLGFGWKAIAEAAAPQTGTLRETYRLLTGNEGDPFPAFRAAVDRVFPVARSAELVDDNPFHRSTNSGFMIQSTFGRRGNFELVLPDPTGGLEHWYRGNDAGNAWTKTTTFGQPHGYESASLIQSWGYGWPGHLEVVAKTRRQGLVHLWRGDDANSWSEPSVVVPSGVVGAPALIQSTFGVLGDFELVFPSADGGITHYTRYNDRPSQPWELRTTFGAEWDFESIAFLQSTFGGNLEVIAKVADGNKLVHYYSPGEDEWYEVTATVPAVAGPPAVIQSSFGETGNFEMVSMTSEDNALAYWTRMDRSPWEWSSPETLVPPPSTARAVSLLQSNFGRGNLEVAVWESTRVRFFWRDVLAGTWHESDLFLL